MPEVSGLEVKRIGILLTAWGAGLQRGLALGVGESRGEVVLVMVTLPLGTSKYFIWAMLVVELNSQ